MSAIAPAVPEAPALDLAGLRQLTFSQLDELYRGGRRPATIAALNGDAEGAMLAWRVPRRGPLAWFLRTWGASVLFPWEGKSFKCQSDDRGEGINRVHLVKRMRWFRFTTRFDASFVDGKPAFILDYSGPGNPPFIRSIVDEVREVAPGLYLGPAALLVKGQPRPILYFAVSF